LRPSFAYVFGTTYLRLRGCVVAGCQVAGAGHPRAHGISRRDKINQLKERRKKKAKGVVISSLHVERKVICSTPPSSRTASPTAFPGEGAQLALVGLLPPLQCDSREIR
jgi:hypothetical protein|tara:strand:+ start:1127 stop:1453 length:327 start_codon:yes stop_codon:yes gene_type:complete